MPVNQSIPPGSFIADTDYRVVFLLLGLALLISLPALLVGLTFGKKAALIVAISSIFLAVPVVLLGAYLLQPRLVRTSSVASNHGAAPAVVVAAPIAEPPPDPTIQAFAARLAEQKTVSDPASRPTWIDQAPGLDQAVYRLPVKSGLYTTQEECRQALAVAVNQAVIQYGKTYLADVDASAGEVLRHVPADLSAKLIGGPLYAETVQASVGPMQQLHALLEFSDDARGELREVWRQASLPRRLRWASCGFGGTLGVVGVLLAALRFDLATAGKRRSRLRWATPLMILLVVGSAWGLCLL